MQVCNIYVKLPTLSKKIMDCRLGTPSRSGSSINVNEDINLDLELTDPREASGFNLSGLHTCKIHFYTSTEHTCVHIDAQNKFRRGTGYTSGLVLIWVLGVQGKLD